MNMKIITLIALALGCLAVVGIANMSDDSDAAVVDPSTGTQVGDLYYTTSGTTATVRGISSSIQDATSITIPDTVEIDGTTYLVTGIYSSTSNGSFQGLTSLQSITLSSNITNLSKYAFMYCSSLVTVNMDNITSIGDYTFNECTSLTYLELPSGLISIGQNAFLNCTALETLSIPLATTSVANNAFQGCTNLTLSLEVSVTAGGDTFTDLWETGLTSSGDLTLVVTAPSTSGAYVIDGWTYMGTDYANGDSITMNFHQRDYTGNAIGADFGACGDNLTATMLFADYVLTITGTGAMYDYSAGSPAPWDSYKASIVSLGLPEGMTTYGDYAFYGCTGLSGILTIPSAITRVGDSAFYDCGYSAMIIEGSPTLTDVSDPTFGSSDGESFKQVLNLGDTVIAAGDYGLPADAVVSDCIPLMGYLGPITFSDTVQKQGAEYDLMLVIPVMVIAGLLMAALVWFGLVRKKDF